MDAPGHQQLVLFAGAVALLLLSPGPNMAFVMAHGATLGWRGGVAAAAGIALSDVVMTVLVALGVAALFTTEPAMRALRLAGAAYLGHLAWTSWTRRPARAAVQACEHTLFSVTRRAALNSLLNPKSILFFVAFLPSFASPAAPLAPQVLVLGLLLAAIALPFHVIIGMAGDVAARGLRAGSGRRWALVAGLSGKVLAILFACLALRLLVS